MRPTLRPRVTVVTGPAIEPVTLDEAKEFARVTDTADDALMAALISTAVASVELHLKRSLITQTVKQTLDLPHGQDDWCPGYFEMPVNIFAGRLPDRIRLLGGPVQSITSVVTYTASNTSSTYAASNYRLSDDRLVLNDTAVWPTDIREYGGVEITYVAGYGSTAGDIPQPIRTAILMTVAALFDGRGQCDASGLAPGAARLLMQYRVMDGNHG